MGARTAMNDPKPLASLNGALLARKGRAKPAMRSQMFQPHPPVGEQNFGALEDLGWNDMGDVEDHRHADILPLTPAPVNIDAQAEARADDAEAAAQLAANARSIKDANGKAANGALHTHIHAGEPEIRRQIEKIEAKLAEAAESGSLNGSHARDGAAKARKVAKTDAPNARKPASADKQRAAFTLRLDSERHLMLRLACTIRNRSAQQIVTEALDRLLADIDNLKSLAAQVKGQ